MSILFASSEIFPYAKSGGLADVAHSLPQALREYETVYTVMPLYDIVNRAKHKIIYSGTTFSYALEEYDTNLIFFTKKIVKKICLFITPFYVEERDCIMTDMVSLETMGCVLVFFLMLF